MAKSKEEKARQSKERMAEYRKTEAYRQWLIESRELRRKLKEKYRREKGAKTLASIAECARKAREEKEQKRAARKMFKAVFIGPPSPRTVLSDAEYQRWKYKATGGNYDKSRRKKNIDQLRDSYVAQQLGMKVSGLTSDLVLMKREQLLFSRQLRKLKKELKEVLNGE